MTEEDSSYASITYLVTGLPKLEPVRQLVEYFGLKRNCGGAGEIADCEAISGNSILLTYEKTAGITRHNSACIITCCQLN